MKNGSSGFNPNTINKYGFSESSQPRLTKKSAKITREREQKWFEMLNNWDDYYKNNYDKVVSRCRKGIPHALRAAAWRALTGAADLMKSNKGLFEELTATDTRWAGHIDKDLPRTYQMHEMFTEKDGIGQQEMRKVLIAYSAYCPKIGYCQGMSSIAGILLMIMPAEQAFWTFVAIMDRYLLGYYSEGLLALQLDGKVMENLVKLRNEKVEAFLKKNKLEACYYAVEWFMCGYTRNLPWATVLRVWDIFLCEGGNVLINVGVTILLLAFKDQAVRDACTSFDKAIRFLKYKMPKDLLDEDVFIEEYFQVRLSDKEIQEEHIRQLAKLEEIVP